MWLAELSCVVGLCMFNGRLKCYVMLSFSLKRHMLYYCTINLQFYLKCKMCE